MATIFYKPTAVTITPTAETTIDPWYRWNTTATTSGTFTIDPWQTWATTTTGNATTLHYDPAYTWGRWKDADHTYYYQAPVVHEPTQEELDAAQRRREDQNARLLAERVRLDGAEDRARQLFRSLLTADQITTMDEDNEVWVTGSDGGIYVIETWDGRVHGNIRAVDEHGCMLGRLCVQPGMYDHVERAALPSSDGYVGQLLAIRFNEKILRETANWSGRQVCHQPDVPILRAA